MMPPKFRLLRADEIEVRVKQVSEKGATALLYKTARTDMDVLDETVGADHWSCQYADIKGNLYCGIDIDGICKWNCGVESKQDSDGNEKKGEASDAFKRSGFCWGIGRELYTSPFIFLKTKTENKNGKMVVSDFATFSVNSIECDEKRRIVKLTITNDKTGEVVFSFSASSKKSARPQPEQEKPASDENEDAPDVPADDIETEIAKTKSIIIRLGLTKGLDEKTTIHRAEEFVLTKFGELVFFNNMNLAQLTEVKLAINKLKSV